MTGIHKGGSRARVVINKRSTTLVEMCPSSYQAALHLAGLSLPARRLEATRIESRFADNYRWRWDSAGNATNPAGRARALNPRHTTTPPAAQSRLYNGSGKVASPTNAGVPFPAQFFEKQECFYTRRRGGTFNVNNELWRSFVEGRWHTGRFRPFDVQCLRMEYCTVICFAWSFCCSFWSLCTWACLCLFSGILVFQWW